MERPTEQIYTLEYPVQHDGETITELTLRRIKARDAMTLDKVSPAKQGLALIGLIARVPLPVIEEMDADDWEGVQRAAIPFMPKSFRTTYEAVFSAADKTLASMSDEAQMQALLVKLTEGHLTE